MKVLMGVVCLAVALPSASQAAVGPFPYSYVGNAVVNGSGGCSAVQGVFPATASINVDSDTGAVTSYYLNIIIQNPKKQANGQPILAPQYITDVLSPNTTGVGALTAYDPQLLGAGTALTGVAGSYTGQLTFPNSSFLELGTNFGQPSQTSIVLTAPIAATGQSCILSVAGVLKTVPN